MNKISVKKFLPGIAWFFVVLILMCMPGEDVPKVDWLERISFDKIVHIGVFGLLAVLFCWPFYKSGYASKERLQYFVKISIAVSIWGLAIEFIQKFFIPGRSFDMVDWAADSTGAALSYWFCSKMFTRRPVT
ncbi:MAG: VanZ family protein [Ginsengibacter sp.]